MSARTNPDTLGFLLSETSRLVRNAFEKGVAEAGLEITAGEARALVHVAAVDGARQTAIAERMGVEPMTVCAYLDRLENIGLVSRSPDPTDRRAKNIYITAAADSVLVAIRKQTAAIYDVAQAGLDEEQQAALMSILKVLRANLQAASADKAPTIKLPLAERVEA